MNKYMKDPGCSHEPIHVQHVCVHTCAVLPAGDTAPGPRGHAAATATAALPIRTPRVPVI